MAAMSLSLSSSLVDICAWSSPIKMLDFVLTEAQLNLLNNGPVRIFNSEEKCEGVGSSEEEDQDNSGGETELPEIDPRAEDRELKNHLLRKYSGYLSSLKQELSKKKKKGKLPKEARPKLLNWWELHYKWPYPSETEKVALAESTAESQKKEENKDASAAARLLEKLSVEDERAAEDKASEEVSVMV
ncbi:hypothetical protein TEA_011358 [Camellia sinensis var. sinensis]|uniref:ELK domain-containing protein n=1 Tax=Camellia sinensis var. sinensis TaxID=542762 RepID=A0A4V3WN36_CAMSN|nr:hypothetical protein TEA_011358 [Camellia sinensis var. sinensis]